LRGKEDATLLAEAEKAVVADTGLRRNLLADSKGIYNSGFCF